MDWTEYSADKNYCRNIRDNVPGMEFILKLRPVTYNFDAVKHGASVDEIRKKYSGSNLVEGSPSELILNSRKEKTEIVYTGFIAQEVEAIAKSIGYDFSGVSIPGNENGLYGLSYG